MSEVIAKKLPLLVGRQSTFEIDVSPGHVYLIITCPGEGVACAVRFDCDEAVQHAVDVICKGRDAAMRLMQEKSKTAMGNGVVKPLIKP